MNRVLIGCLVLLTCYSGNLEGRNIGKKIDWMVEAMGKH